MKKSYWLALAILFSVFLAVGAYLWAIAMTDSIFSYRSPLRQNPPASGQALGKPITRRVVFVLVDALREDTSLKSNVMPFLGDLRQHGAWATMHSRPPSYSEPGYSTLLTGAWPDINDGPTINLDYEDIPTFTQDDLFSAVHRSGIKTAISGYYWFEKLVPQESVNTNFYTQGEDRVADREVVDAALPWLASGEYQLVLIHIDQVDYAGHHEGGPRDPNWDAAARRADDLLGEIVAKLDLSKDTLLVLSDHGQIDRGGHGGQDPVTLQEPFVLVGAGVQPGHFEDVQMVDVAPTLAALLGASIPASSQGRVLTEMLSLSQEQVSSIQRATQVQQSQLVRAYQAAIGSQVELRPNDGSVKDTLVAYQSALEASRLVRLNAERLPRAILALVVVLFPAMYLTIKRGRRVYWLLAGAFCYLGLFNLRYVVIEGRTYSLSSLLGLNDVVFFSLVTVSFALLLSWLVVMWGVKGFRQGTAQASQLTMGLALLVIYVLSILVMWSFALNGAITTWTLPDLGSSFLALLALIQILMVATLGIALTGLAALIAHFVKS